MTQPKDSETPETTPGDANPDKASAEDIDRDTETPEPAESATEEATETGAAAGADAALAEENAALKDRLVRAFAELENTRKRALREREDALKFGMQKFARDMCDVADNLQRALDAIDAATANEETASVLQGVAVTRDALKQIFERHGIEEIEAINRKFDPNLHEAMTEIDVPGAPPGACIEVIEKGYLLQGRLLRPARVVVAKAPAANKAGAGEAGTDTSA